MSVFAQLQPFILNDDHERLLERLFEWSSEGSSAADREAHAQRTFFAGTFGYKCAPPKATPDQVFLSTKFLSLFFLIDDASASEMDGIVAILEGTAVSEPSPAIAQFQRYWHDLIESLSRVNPRTDAFEHALERICTAMQREKHTPQTTWTHGSLISIRKVVVGIPAFTECWRTILGIVLTPEVNAGLEEQRILDITCETACLVNDLASFDRDVEDMEADASVSDPNLVVQRMLELGRGEGVRDEAIDLEIERYNELIGAFLQAKHALRAKFSADEDLARYLGILENAIRGDLETSLLLVPMRYPGGESRLEQLRRLPS